MNKVVLAGRLTKDPEQRQAGNTSVTRFSIAVNRDFKKDEADFINCVAFGKTGDAIAQFFSKGRPIMIVGRIQTGKYEKDGKTVYSTDVIVDSFEFMLKDNTEQGQAQSSPNYDNIGQGAGDDEEVPF